MRLSRPLLIALSASFAAIFVSATVAEAQTRARAKAKPQGRPLTVQQRSFLDPGKVVPLGSESNYVWSGQYSGRSPESFGQRSRYGGETLPGRFDIPQQPLFNF